MTNPVTSPSAHTVDSHGSTLEYCSKGQGEVDTFLAGIDVIPQIASGEEWEDDTELAAASRSYIKKDLPEDQDLELVLRDQPANTSQKAFTELVESRTPISMKITRASGRIQSFIFLPQNHHSGESGKESGKQLYGCIGKLQEIQFSIVEA